jgi:glycosyltransferase involved in cell wall biosynthesis
VTPHAHQRDSSAALGGGGLVVNGRFLRAPATGLHRAGRSLLHAARDGGLDFEVMAPTGVDDDLVDRLLPAPPGRGSDHLWEQLVLPVHTRGRPVLSVANTAPLASRHGIVWVHDLAPLVGPQWFSRTMQVYGHIVLAAARRAEHVLAPSQQVADELTGRGVTAPVTVLRQAVEPEFVAAGADEVQRSRERFGLDRDYLLFVGWADPRKDVATAVAAHRVVAARRPHDLVLVGLQHRVFRPVAVPPLPTVRQVGYVDETSLRALLTGATALLYPSRYEGFGRPPLEAWRCGTTALVSDVPAIREATLGRATYVPPGAVGAWADAIEAALAGSVPVPEPDPWTWAQAAQQLRVVVG